MDEFYRLFLVPGLGHCFGGPGAWNFGQIGLVEVNSTAATPVLPAMVEWVENGNAPDTLVGVASDGVTTRTHCRYPMKSVWDGSEWTCQ